MVHDGRLYNGYSGAQFGTTILTSFLRRKGRMMRSAVGKKACRAGDLSLLHLVTWSEHLGLDTAVPCRAIGAEKCHGIDVSTLG